MTSKRVLLSCTVISLQDTRFLYPCCNFCLSRLIEECDLRSRCPKCGLRYDNKNIFGLTVFGGCLNSFFGITAGDLQRFVCSERQGLQSVQHLLTKAVEDCFIGKCFVFGFKASGLDSVLFHEHTSSQGFSTESAQFVACQIISPNGDFLGITVFAYLQRLLEACCFPHPSVSTKAVCQLQQKDSLVSSFEHTPPLCSETSCSGLTLSCLWQPTTDLVLSFSPEKTSGHSLQQLSIDGVHNELSCLVDQVKSDYGVWYTAFCTFKQCESSVEQNSRSASVNSLSTMLSMADKSDSFAAQTSLVVRDTLKPTTTMSCGLESERPPWISEMLSGRECSASFFGKSLFNYSVQNGSIDLGFDAPLSETLRGFVNRESQISKEVNMKVLGSASKCSTLERDWILPQKTNCVLLEDHMVLGCSSDIQALCSYQSALTPLHNISNIIKAKGNEKSLKRKHAKRKVLSSSKRILHTLKVSQVPKDYSVLSCGTNSKVNNLTKNSVSTICWLPNGQSGYCFEDIMQVDHAVCPEMQSQDIEKQITFGEHKDEYNCSADLFYQNDTDTNAPDVTERSDCDPEIKKCHILDISVSGPEVLSSFHFEPSLQSTPRAYPYNKCSYAQSCESSKKDSVLQCSKKLMTRTSVRVMRNHSDIRHGSKAGKTELSQTQSSDFSFKNHEASTSDSEVERNTEHELEDSVLHSNINEWSRDLFAYSF
ncbi:uncharacterized protein ddias [Electrophorus electricus]|uniref:uncharacterized protein ddias n=1 Tax=Electrophorus electricus TaxID=8005 RepID=UPI0015CF902D|nr:uncharacterized protein ddias [Electrophorus electricus]